MVEEATCTTEDSAGAAIAEATLDEATQLFRRNTRQSRHSHPKGRQHVVGWSWARKSAIHTREHHKNVGPAHGYEKLGMTCAMELNSHD